MKKTLKIIATFVRTYWLFVFAALGAIIGLVLTFFHYPTAANWVLGSAALIAVIPLLVRMSRDVQSGKYGVDILAALAIVTAVILGQFWAAIVVVIMLTGGESLEVYAAHRASSELRALLRRAPSRAHVVHKGKEYDVKASEVRPRDVVVVRPGEVVPVDAVIVDGSSTFDESSLTGESLPQGKDAGDKILSGSVNGGGLVRTRATHAAADSQYQQIIRLVRSAADHPAPFARLADRYSIPFTITALTIGGVAWILGHDSLRFLDVLVVATPCPLILATPIALIAGMGRASRDGIVIKTGTALELLAQAKTFAFDKTGTLTKGKPEVDEVIALSPFKKTEVLMYAATVEQYSNHVLAAALVRAAAAKKMRLTKTRHIQELAGRGLEAHVRGTDILVGRLSLLADRGVALPRHFAPKQVAQMATFVAVNGRLAGYITFRDEARADASPTLKALRGFGVKELVMVTGDHRPTAEAIAKPLGIKTVIAEALPADKLIAVEKLVPRPVAFVGDGVNDAPVLMAADIGIALGARGSTAASESADVVIMKDSLSLVARAVAIARRSFRIATQSIVVGIGLSVVLMLIFATGRFSPIAGAIVQELVDVLVIFNALRAHRAGRSRHANERG